MPPKRKSAPAQEEAPRRSTRRRTLAAPAPEPPTAAPAPAKGRAAAASGGAKRQKSEKQVAEDEDVDKAKGEEEGEQKQPPQEPAGAKAKGRGNKAGAPAAGAKKSGEKQTANGSEGKAGKKETNAGEADAAAERSYWLLKAEPETRLERGVDVRFSIDDLAAATARGEPEPWDGIRNYVARNNLRAMKQGDLAFFYHSNCKEPGIVGTMEIVREHTPDMSAHNPKAPYYDPKSKADDPKWSVVHVEFRSKFKEQIGLKELREMGKSGAPLESMQLLKQSRLSVSRVSQAEWDYLNGVARDRGGETK